MFQIGTRVEIIDHRNRLQTGTVAAITARNIDGRRHYVVIWDKYKDFGFGW